MKKGASKKSVLVMGIVFIILALTVVCYGDSNSLTGNKPVSNAATSGNPSGGIFSGYIGTWASTGKVAPAVKLTIGALLAGVPDKSDKDTVNNYFSGEVVCSSLKGGKAIISAKPGAPGEKANTINIQQYKGRIKGVWVYAGDPLSCQVIIVASLYGNDLAGAVSIGKYPKYIYQTSPNGGDAFKRQ